jgi:DNA-binding response OmpR family regulator
MINVLMIDDEEGLLDLGRIYMEEAGISLDTASDLTTARKFLSEKKYKVVIVDYGLPGENGVEFIRSLPLSDTSYIVLSGSPRDEVVMDGIEASYFQKGGGNIFFKLIEMIEGLAQ